MKPTQIRIAAGLEDIEVLLEDFRVAVQAEDMVKNKNDKRIAVADMA